MPLSSSFSKSDSHIPSLVDADQSVESTENEEIKDAENGNGDLWSKQDKNMNEILQMENDDFLSEGLFSKNKISKKKKMGHCCRSMFSVNTIKKILPITCWLPRYNFGFLRSDIIAGLTVGLTVIPQGLAYAAVAGLELQYGLYSAFMGCFIYCLLGTSKDITLGPTAIMSILVAEYAKDPWKDEEGDETSNVTLAILLTITCGITQILMSIFRLGFLVHFISHPVIAGFTSAASVVIACSQIKKILGIHASREFFHMLTDIVHNIGNTKYVDWLVFSSLSDRLRGELRYTSVVRIRRDTLVLFLIIIGDMPFTTICTHLYYLSIYVFC